MSDIGNLCGHFVELTKVRDENKQLEAELEVLAQEASDSGGEIWLGSMNTNKVPRFMATYERLEAEYRAEEVEL